VFIGQGMGPRLLVRLMGAMYLTSPNTTWYSICECATMWLWSQGLRSPIYSKGRPKASKSCGHECVGFKQPSSLVPLLGLRRSKLGMG